MKQRDYSYRADAVQRTKARRDLIWRMEEENMRENVSVQKMPEPKIQRLTLSEDDLIKALDSAALAKDKVAYMQALRIENGTYASSNKVRSTIDKHMQNSDITTADAWEAVCLQVIGTESSWDATVKNFIDGTKTGIFIPPALTLPPATAEGIKAEISKLANTAANTGIATDFTNYQSQFNALWSTSKYAGLTLDFDKTLSSEGPRTQKARAIFKDIMAGDATLKTAYDTDSPSGTQGRIDQYVGPDGLNLLASPRLQELVQLFTGVSAPMRSGGFKLITDPGYATFKTTILPVVEKLDYKDREAIAHSQQWQSVISMTAKTAALSDDLSMYIQNTYAAFVPVANTTVTGVKTGNATEQLLDENQKKFIDKLKLQRGTSKNITSDQEEVDLSFFGKSPKAPVGLTVNSEVELSPGQKVKSGQKMALSWGPADKKGPLHKFKVLNDSTGSGGSTTFTGMLNLQFPGKYITYPYVPPTSSVVVTDDRLNWFQNNVGVIMSYSDQMTSDIYQHPYTDPVSGRTTPASRVEYYGGQSRIGLYMRLPASNRGLQVYIEADLLQNGKTKYAYTRQAFGKHETVASLGSAVVQESGSKTADNIAASVRFYSGTSTVPFLTIPYTFDIYPGKTFTEAQLVSAAVADNTELNDPAPGKLLDTMIAKGGQAERTAEAIKAGTISLEPLLLLPDSAAYVTSKGGDPQKQVAYLAGYHNVKTEAIVGVPDAGGMRIGDRPHKVYVNRTLSLATGKTKSIKEMMDFVVHESVHLLDERPGAGTYIEAYKTEFRAYWMEGDATRDLLSTAYNPSLDNKGPKSDKARDIFDLLYNSTTYPFVKQQYDADRMFREEVNRYIFPDGINLIVSLRIENLRKAVDAYNGTGFDAHRLEIINLYGFTKREDQTEISGNRMWQDLVERKYTNPAELKDIKTILKIP